MNLNKYVNNYFLLLFSIIPLTFIAGSAILVTNILLINISFIILIIYFKDFSFLKSKPIIYLLIFYIYLIFNSTISLNFFIGFERNFGFLRFIILFTAFNYFFLEKDFYKKIFKFWIIIFLIVSFDVFIEQFSGSNIFGFNYGDRFGTDGVKYDRIVSFFKDEPIVGSFINGFYLLLFGFLLNELKKHKLIFSFGLLLIFFMAIVLTGERSSTIKAFLGLLLFIFFIRQIDFKMRISIIFCTIILILFLLMNLRFVNIRYVSNIPSILTTHTIYFDLYKSGLQVFENNKFFGVGNKNYRIETCLNKTIPNNNKKEYYLCNSHPHQIYLEFLSEHGLFGTIFIFYIFYKLIFSKIVNTFNNSNYLRIGSLIYMIFVFTPLLPSGAFFSNNLLTIFMINFSIFFAVDQKSNAFKLKGFKNISEGR